MSKLSIRKSLMEPSYTYAMGMKIPVESTVGVEVVIDPYTGKMYGEKDKEFYLSRFQSQISAIESSLQKVSQGFDPRTKEGGQLLNNNSAFNIPTRLSEKDQKALTKEYTSQLKKFQTLLKDFPSKYQQEERFFESYDLYKDQWDAKFKGEEDTRIANYRNPRIEEEQKTGQVYAQNRVNKQLDLRQSLLAIPTGGQSTPTPKTIGTGISSSRGSTNPFGLIESGLNV